MARPSPVVAAAGASGGGWARPRFEVADVVNGFGQDFLATPPASIEQRRVLRAIAACRTKALGGHVEQCRDCSYQRIAYNSCRNRHCPKCQGQERAKWMAAEQAMLLPVPYFHVVFTLPHTLNPLIRVNRRRLYALLFRVAARTLGKFALDPEHLGAEPAVTMVLHTWGQTLGEHIHVHCVVSGGGLSLDGRHWVRAHLRSRTRRRRRRRPFLFPVRALSRVFRAKYIAALKRARRRGILQYVGESALLQQPAPWQSLLDDLSATPWVVYAKRPLAGPERVLKYLSAYSHRVAISNQRIVSVGDDVVRFAYRDYADHNRRKEMELPGTQFLRRFLQHVLPTGFVRIRHYGITANPVRKQKLARARELLGVEVAATRTDAPDPLPEQSAPAPGRTDGEQPSGICPACGGPLCVAEHFAATASTTVYDTS